MANSITGLNPTLFAAEVMFQQDKQMILGNIFKKVYQGVAQMGGAVSIPYIGNITGGLKTRGTAISAAEDVDDSVKTITIDHQPYFMLSIEDIEAIQAAPDLFAVYALKGGQTIAAQTETQLLTNVTAIATGNTVTVDALSGIADDLLSAVEKLNIAKAPMTDRWAVLSPTLYNAVMALDNFQSASNLGDNSIVRYGQVGQIFGLNVVMHPDMYNATVESCLVAHADWLGVVFQTEPVIKVSDYALNLGSYLYGYRVFGDAVLESSLGIKLKYTR